MQSRQQKPIEINNFLKMTPQVPQFSAKNTNYLVAGVNPISYLDDGSQEEQIAPLAAAIDWAQITGTIEGNIVHMIPSTGGTYILYFVTDTTKVYGVTSAFVITDLGYPTGSSNNNVGCYLAIGGGGTTTNGFLFMTFSIGGAVYKMPLSSGSWTSFGTIQTASGVHIMEPFLDFIALRDGSTSFYQGGLVKKIDVTSFQITTGLDLGAGFGVMQMRNYNDKYLAIAAGKTSAGSSTNGYPQNYLFLWDGISDRYNYSCKIPGQFIDMKVVDSVLYVAVKVSSGKTCIYYLSGTKLKKLFTTQISTVRGSVYSATPCSLFDFKNYLGIHLTTTSDLTEPIMVYGDDEMGAIEFVHSSGRLFDQIAVGYDGNLFANKYVSASNSTLWYLPITIGSGIYQNILYKSQWIPCKNLSAIDIYYDTPPATGTDAINVTIYGQGEDIIAGNSTTVLDSITPTNNLTAKRTRLDLKGFTGDQIMIKISTVNSTWRPKINSIVLI